MDLTTPNREAIRLLREAQDLMNDKGRHWTKGTYRRHDDEPMIRRTAPSVRSSRLELATTHDWRWNTAR